MNQPLLTPPHSEHAEQAVLGAILTNNELLDDVLEVIKVDDFYNRGHREIFTAIEQLVKSKKPADVVTLSNQPQFDLPYCTQLVRNCPSSRNAVAYAQTIKRNSIQRKLIAAANEIADDAFAKCDNELELVGNAEKKLSKITDGLTIQTKDNSAEAILKKSVDHLNFMATSGRTILGTETSLPDLDDRINGLKKGSFVIIAARPSMGKTTLAFQIVANNALNGGNPIVFSLETPAETLMLKAISNYGNVDFGRLQKARLQDHEWASVGDITKRLAKSKLEIIDTSSITTEQIRLETRSYAKRHGNPSMIMIDYIQLIRGKAENRTQEISEISRDLKAISLEFDCPLIGLSQLNRTLESRSDKRPILSDLRESGQLEQDADDIIVIYRDEIYNEESPDKGKAEIIVRKIKTGVRGTIVTHFQGEFQRFDESKDQTIHSNKPNKKSFQEKFGG